jgi:luciferase family oxidoreductase group 1
MPLPLSVLDLSPVRAGSTGADAIRETVAFAKEAERLGYRRFWMSEHHGTEAFAGSAPEMLMAAITQATKTIRIGSGGVMLVNWSPLKVAEQFMILEALAPGRIDLGLGRALGTDMRTGAALRSAGSEAFPQFFALLSAWLLDSSGKVRIGPEHPARGIFAQPRGPSHPALFLLTSSIESAVFAGHSGVGMVFAEFIAANSPNPPDAGDVVAAYRNAFRPSIFAETPFAGVGLGAFAAETADEAERLDAPRKAWSLAFLAGRPSPFPSIEDAQAVLAQYRDSPLMERVRERAIVGDGAAVRATLAQKLKQTGADELFVITFAPTFEDRVKSLELMIA